MAFLGSGTESTIPISFQKILAFLLVCHLDLGISVFAHHVIIFFIGIIFVNTPVNSVGVTLWLFSGRSLCRHVVSFPSSVCHSCRLFTLALGRRLRLLAVSRPISPFANSSRYTFATGHLGRQIWIWRRGRWRWMGVRWRVRCVELT